MPVDQRAGHVSDRLEAPPRFSKAHTHTRSRIRFVFCVRLETDCMAVEHTTSTNLSNWDNFLNLESCSQDEQNGEWEVRSGIIPTSGRFETDSSTDFGGCTVAAESLPQSPRAASFCLEDTAWSSRDMGIGDYLLLSRALSDLAVENQRLRERVRELEALVCAQSTRTVEARSSPDNPNEAASQASCETNGKPPTNGQRMIVGFACVTKSVLRELASFLTISNGQLGWTGASQVGTPPPSENEDAKGYLFSSPCTESESIAKGSTSEPDPRWRSKRSTSADDRHAPDVPGAKRARHEAKSRVSYCAAARFAASGAIYSIFFFFSLALLPPLFDMLGFAFEPWLAASRTLALPAT
jgi:hypothetical protein